MTFEEAITMNISELINPSDQFSIKDAVGVDMSNLNKEFLMHSKYTVYFSAMLAKAKREMNDAKTALDVGYASIDREAREVAKNDKTTKYTETIFENIVTLHAKYQERLKLLHDAEYRVDLLVGAVKAIDRKGEMLIQLGANDRKGMFDPRVNKQQ